jgi:hypothetical protein
MMVEAVVGRLGGLAQARGDDGGGVQSQRSSVLRNFAAVIRSASLQGRL